MEEKGWYILKYIKIHPHPTVKGVCDIFQLSRTASYWWFNKVGKKPCKEFKPIKRKCIEYNLCQGILDKEKRGYPLFK